jgi:hypothetical protein
MFDFLETILNNAECVVVNNVALNLSFALYADNITRLTLI